MFSTDYAEAVRSIRTSQNQYEEDAYYFLKECLDFTVQDLKKRKVQLKGNHLSGPQLLNGIRRHALEKFGPLALTVFHSWNIRSTRDFGVMVFQLVEAGVLGKTEEDRLEDFENCFDFDKAFLDPFLPGKPTLSGNGEN